MRVPPERQLGAGSEPAQLGRRRAQHSLAVRQRGDDRSVRRRQERPERTGRHGRRVDRHRVRPRRVIDQRAVRRPGAGHPDVVLGHRCDAVDRREVRRRIGRTRVAARRAPRPGTLPVPPALLGRAGGVRQKVGVVELLAAALHRERHRCAEDQPDHQAPRAPSGRSSRDRRSVEAAPATRASSSVGRPGPPSSDMYAPPRSIPAARGPGVQRASAAVEVTTTGRRTTRAGAPRRPERAGRSARRPRRFSLAEHERDADHIGRPRSRSTDLRARQYVSGRQRRRAARRRSASAPERVRRDLFDRDARAGQGPPGVGERLASDGSDAASVRSCGPGEVGFEEHVGVRGVDRESPADPVSRRLVVRDAASPPGPPVAPPGPRGRTAWCPSSPGVRRSARTPCRPCRAGRISACRDRSPGGTTADDSVSIPGRVGVTGR